MILRYSITTLVRILGAGAQLALMFAVTWMTGNVEAGIFFFGYSIMVILATLSRLGTEISGLREISRLLGVQDHAGIATVVRARVVVTALLSVGFAAFLSVTVAEFASDRLGGPNAVVSIQLYALTLPAFALTGLFTEFLKAADRATIAVLYQNTMVPLLTVAGLGAASLFGQTDARAAAAAMAAATWATLALSLVSWSRWRRASLPGQAADPPRLGWSDFGLIFRDSPALIVVSSTSIIMQWIGSAMLGFLANASLVAGFSVAVRLSVTVSIVNSAVVSVMAPRMANAHARGQFRDLRRLSHQTSMIITAVTAPPLLAIFLFAGTWLSLFDPHFVSFVPELRILVLGQIVAAIIGHSGTVLVMAGLYRDARTTSVTAGVTLFVLMLVMMPLLGTVGASIAMSTGVIAGHAAAFLLARQKLGLWTLPTRTSDFSYAMARTE